jgi:hypothetical protein
VALHLDAAVVSSATVAAIIERRLPGRTFAFSIDQAHVLTNRTGNHWE